MPWIYAEGPIGKGDSIKSGECISSIAVREGIKWKDVWEHPDNDKLKRTREHPNILLPGDKVTVPKKKQKQAAKQDQKRHRMRMKGVPGILRLRFTKYGRPRKGDAYRLDVDGYVRQGGKLDDDGSFEAKIWPGARTATIRLGKDQDNLVEKFEYKLGWIAPANEPLGIQTRLWNLNYYHGKLTSDFDKETERALLRFMQKNAIGDAHKSALEDLEWDSLSAAHQLEAIERLVKVHGC
ncbi:MAG: hypothetical protein JW836_17355 [Deltaproteobacteria bacterium]|nr:hypothetical protein [Deltaproteobacteria bacterium]